MDIETVLSRIETPVPCHRKWFRHYVRLYSKKVKKRNQCLPTENPHHTILPALPCWWSVSWCNDAQSINDDDAIASLLNGPLDPAGYKRTGRFDSLSQSRLDTYNADVISFDCRNGLEGNPANGDHFFRFALSIIQSKPTLTHTSRCRSFNRKCFINIRNVMELSEFVVGFRTQSFGYWVR